MDRRVQKETRLPDRRSRAVRSCSPEYRSVGASKNNTSLVRDDHARCRATFYVPGGLWVRGLSSEITADMLRACFERYGKVDKVRFLQKRAGRNESAYVNLEEAGTAQNILRGKYGSLMVPGSHHVIEPSDIKPLGRLSGEAARSSGSCERRPPQRDDWECPACGNLVFSNKNSCGWIFKDQDGRVCGARRPAPACSRDHIDWRPPQYLMGGWEDDGDRGRRAGGTGRDRRLNPEGRELEQLNLDCSSRPTDADAAAHRNTPGVMVCDSPSTHGLSSRRSLPQDPRFVNSLWM